MTSGSRSSTSTPSGAATSCSTRTSGWTHWVLSWMPGRGDRVPRPLHLGCRHRGRGRRVARGSPRLQGLDDVQLQLRAGDSRQGGPGYIHRVRHELGEPAVTIHVYSPRLDWVGQYRLRRGEGVRPPRGATRSQRADRPAHRRRRAGARARAFLARAPVAQRFRETRPLTPETFGDLETLFGRPGGSIVRGCWCMFYRRSGKPTSGVTNHDAMHHLVCSGTVPGLVGYLNAVAGWISLGPREEYAKLERSPIMKPIDDAKVWSIVCTYGPPRSRAPAPVAGSRPRVCARARRSGPSGVPRRQAGPEPRRLHVLRIAEPLRAGRVPRGGVALADARRDAPAAAAAPGMIASSPGFAAGSRRDTRTRRRHDCENVAGGAVSQKQL